VTIQLCGVHNAAVTVESDGPVATVTFCRPPVNATVPEAIAAIGHAFRSLGDDRGVRVAIFTGCGTRAFMAGADLKGALRTDPDDLPPGRVLDPGAFAREALWAVYDCAVPVIGAVNGAAVGGGLAFASLCDFLVASETARFGTTEINAGLLGASSQLVRMVGPYKARRMFFTGQLVSAHEMYRLGAVEAVVPADELLPTARALAEELTAKSPIALRLAKEAMNRTEFLPLKEAYRLEQDYTNRLLGFDDAGEARAAFAEKRDPVWRWR
jgi:enoyl-CoA hydratase